MPTCFGCGLEDEHMPEDFWCFDCMADRRAQRQRKLNIRAALEVEVRAAVASSFGSSPPLSRDLKLKAVAQIMDGWRAAYNELHGL